MENIIITTEISSPVGLLLGGATKKGICILEFSDKESGDKQSTLLGKKFNKKLVKGDSPLLDKLKIRLDEYFKGE